MQSDDMAKMGRPPKEDRSEVRSLVVPPIRVTAEELETLREGAEIDGKALGAWLRDLGLARRRAQQRKR
jgi:hypothetical protein